MSNIWTSLIRNGNSVSRVIYSTRQSFCTTCIRCKIESSIGRRVESSIGRKTFAPKPPKEGIGVGYFLLSIPLVTFGLGTWQVQRRKWKLDLIDQLEQTKLLSPVDMPENLHDLDDLEYRRVRVRGTFDHSRELFVMMRSPMAASNKPGGADGGGLFSGKSQIGNHVITAFKLADRDLTILVNRGWVPSTQKKAVRRPQGQIEGEVEFVGVVRRTEKRAPFGPKRMPGSNEWYNRDIYAMAQDLNTAPVFIDADEDSTVPGGPIGGQTRLFLRNEHLSYIFTWYSLCFLTSIGWYMSYLR